MARETELWSHAVVSGDVTNRVLSHIDLDNQFSKIKT
jgi:hypothetical protein